MIQRRFLKPVGAILESAIGTVSLIASILVYWPKWWCYRLSQLESINIQVGCGKNRFKGWINADMSPSADLIIFLGWRLPFASGTVDRVYSEHVLEHVDREIAQFHLKEVYRVLSDDGVLRIAMPDLDDTINCYKNDWRSADWVNWPEFSFVESRVQAINMVFRSWGHQYLYNQSEVELVLTRAGFSNVKFCLHGESQDSELRGRETRGDSKLVVEARKK